MKTPIFTGSCIAIITPFKDGGRKIDYDKFEKIINYQIEHKTDAICVCGTTGEAPTLTDPEHISAVRFCCEIVGGRIPVIAGTGSNDTAHAVMLSNEVEKCGADALLLVTPYYNKTSQEGLIKHYYHIADNVNLPMVLYNVPSRTGVNIKPETYLELSKHPRINACKEANGDISSVAKTRALCGDELNMYSGNDDQIFPITAYGGKGVISVLSHVAPEVAHDIAALAVAGEYEKSRAMQLEWLDLCNALFCDVNPIPVKAAMNLMGWDVGDCRLPLPRLSDDKTEFLASVMRKHGLIA
ncbi:MAG: 4-hydroxy-tetrahydrodipicolinate synthase [Clostridiales bacterium]|nr:4-hydroxy-tetrahydrodipicolinate synthase [Clostridiales bacterium]